MRQNSTSLPRDLRDAGLAHAHLKIGEGIVTSSDILISTVLGSCVSVTFFNARIGLAGIFHAMLPTEHGYRRAGGEPCKFVDSAIALIYEQFMRRGVKNSEIEIKLFGGAYSMDRVGTGDVRSIVDVGGKNVAVAREELKKRGLDIVRENVLGDRGRKLVFDTRTGEVWMKPLGGTDFHPQGGGLASAS